MPRYSKLGYCGPHGKLLQRHNETKCECFDCYGGARCGSVQRCFNDGQYHEIVAISGNIYGACYCNKLFTGPCCQHKLCSPGSVRLPDGSCKCSKRKSGEQCEIVQCGEHGLPNFEGGCACEPHYGGPFCEQFLCLNGGRYVGNGTCECASELDFGEHCEHVRCGRFGSPPGDFSGQCRCTYGFEGRHCSLINPFALVLVIFLSCCLLIVLWTMCQIFRGFIRARKQTHSETSIELRRVQYNRRYDSITNFLTNVWQTVSSRYGAVGPHTETCLLPGNMDPPPRYEEVVQVERIRESEIT